MFNESDDSVAFLLINMDQVLFRQWQDCIEALNETQKVKDVLLEYVKSILKRDGIVILSSDHLASLTGIEECTLAEMISSNKKFYRTFSIPKRTGGERIISAPYPSLKQVQDWIYKELLLPRTQLPDCAVGFIPGKSIVDNATPHIGSKYLLKMDLKDFFPSIKLTRIIAAFQYLGYYPRMAYYLARLCCEDDHLPQGAPTSPILSNIIAKHLDKRLSGLAERYGFVYTRYADDLTFSGDFIPVKFIESVSDVVIEEGFVTNPEKTKILGPWCRKIITGVSISSGRPCIPRTKKRLIRQQAYYIKKYGMKSHIRHCRINDPFYAMRFAGDMAYWKSVEPEHPYVKEYFKK